MALQVEIKAGERIILGDSVITNRGDRTRLVIEGPIPILREKDVMRSEEANTPAKRLYLLAQMMYLASDPRQHFDLYFQIASDIQRAAPSTSPYLERIHAQIEIGAHYKAMKAVKELIAYESDLLAHAKRG